MGKEAPPVTVDIWLARDVATAELDEAPMGHCVHVEPNGEQYVSFLFNSDRDIMTYKWTGQAWDFDFDGYPDPLWEIDGWLMFPAENDGPCQHEWTGRQRGGHPADASSTEWVKFCKLCGIEG